MNAHSLVVSFRQSSGHNKRRETCLGFVDRLVVDMPFRRYYLSTNSRFGNVLACIVTIQLACKQAIRATGMEFVRRRKKTLADEFNEHYSALHNIPLKALTRDERMYLYAQYCADKLVSFPAMCAARKSYLYHHRQLYAYASMSIQRLLRRYQQKKRTIDILFDTRFSAARTIVDTIRGCYFKHMFSRYKALVESLAKTPAHALPTLLKTISPGEAEYAGDCASLLGIRVKLINGTGRPHTEELTQWPPTIVYKLVVQGPVIDQTAAIMSTVLIEERAPPNPRKREKPSEQKVFKEAPTTLVETEAIRKKVTELRRDTYRRVTSEWRTFDDPERVLDFYEHKHQYDRSTRVRNAIRKIERRKERWARKREELIKMKVRATKGEPLRELGDGVLIKQTMDDVDSLLMWADCLDYDEYLTSWLTVDLDDFCLE